MGQSLSRRPAAPPPSISTPTSAPAQGHANNTQTPRRSLPRRIFSSFPKPSLRSRPLSSLTLPTRPEQTLRGKKRRWWSSHGDNSPASIEGAIPDHMDPLAEHDEHQVDRDVDEFGVITHRVPDSHRDTPAATAKGKEKAKDIADIEDVNEGEDEAPIPSSSTAPPPTQSRADKDHSNDDEAFVTPTVLPSPPRQPPSSLPSIQEPERPFVPLPSVPTAPSPSHLPVQGNTGPRTFPPPPGTLVVVQGVVHTTDVPRPSDRPVATPNSTLQVTNDASNANPTNFETSSTRPSSVPPGARSRNHISGILSRPTSIVPTAPASLPLESTTGPSNVDPQGRQVSLNVGSATEESEDEDRTRTHAHGISMAQGPIGASGLSASSIDVLGTLLSVAAAATAASLLTGSSEPIFSSGLTSQPQPSNNAAPPPTSLNSNAPSERPLSPTPTSDAGRMRHVWSNLRDRLGLGSGAHNSNQSNESSGPGQNTPSQPSDFVRPRDPREIMLAEMASAFSRGLGLSRAAANIPSATASANSTTPESAIPDDGNVQTGDRDEHPSPLPPPDSFERFLMDLQTDLRVTLMQEQELGVLGGASRDADDTVGDVEEEQSIPELQSLSDSDSNSGDSEARHFDSDDEDELGCEEHIEDEGDDRDVHTAQEQLSGRTSPAVSALGSGIHSPFGVRNRPGSSSSFCADGTDGDIGTNNSNTNNDKGRDVDAVHASSSVVIGRGTNVPVENINLPGMHRSEESETQGKDAVLGVVHSPEGSTPQRRVEAEGGRIVPVAIAVPPPDAQDPSNVLGTVTERDSLFLGTSPLSASLTTSTPDSPAGGTTLTTQAPTQPSTSTPLPSSDPEPISQNPSTTNPARGDSPMPFRLPFTPSSASRTEHTPGGGINWWRMYRFPAIISPNIGSQGPLPQSQPAFRTSSHGPSHTSTPPRARTTNQNQQNEVSAPLETAQGPGAPSGLAQPAPTPPAATSTNMPEMVSAASQSTSTPPFTSGQDLNSPTNTSTRTNLPEHRSNVVVPVIVVGLQSVNMDRQSPQTPHLHTNHAPTTDDEEGEGLDLDGLEQPMSVPLHIPEPPEFRHHSGPLNTTTQQEHGSQQPARGRTWQSRAANAIRNLRPSRRNADTTSPQPQETPGSRTFLIYVIGGYYPPDHQIITGGNSDSFEALWELAELLGQVKPPTVSKEEIEKSGLEIIQASKLEEYEKHGRIASNCVDRCLICLDDYNPEDELRVLTCKHAFHQGCVDRWLETGRNNCPACRTKGVGSEAVESSSATPADRPPHDI